ncbi:MAG: bifunctional oligoribonuclease/PAP phosphatase NrnA [Campylobacterota bacterium]|nr:bifunctional oligoribonuclease/PAP phosphatase NrnA [Campylobacterota bacterium]
MKSEIVKSITIEQNFYYQEVREKIENAKSITILSHLNPDADALGTALGIYAILKEHTQLKIEVVNASVVLPKYLDFLPYFSKLKNHMDYADSLIISCDCGSIDRLGFALERRDIINIDHHASNTMYGSVNVVVENYASSSQVAFRLFEKLYTIRKEAATCFYAALLSDTIHFTTASVNHEVFTVAKALVENGAKPDEIASFMTQRKSLASVRILEKALASLTLYSDAKVAVLKVSQEDILQTGATVSDMDGIVEFSRALVTVEIAIFAMELRDSVRVSLRSKQADVSKVAKSLGGGGHKLAAGFSVKKGDLEESIKQTLAKVKMLKSLSESII